jgi:hypothetical protein
MLATGRANELLGWFLCAMVSSLWSLLAVRVGAPCVQGSRRLMTRHKQGAFCFCYSRLGRRQDAVTAQRDDPTAVGYTPVKPVSVRSEATPWLSAGANYPTTTSLPTPPPSAPNFSKPPRPRDCRVVTLPYSASFPSVSDLTLHSGDENEDSDAEEERWERTLLERFLRARSVSPAPF